MLSTIKEFSLQLEPIQVLVRNWNMWKQLNGHHSPVFTHLVKSYWSYLNTVIKWLVPFYMLILQSSKEASIVSAGFSTVTKRQCNFSTLSGLTHAFTNSFWTWTSRLTMLFLILQASRLHLRQDFYKAHRKKTGFCDVHKVFQITD